MTDRKRKKMKTILAWAWCALVVLVPLGMIAWDAWHGDRFAPFILRGLAEFIAFLCVLIVTAYSIMWLSVGRK